MRKFVIAAGAAVVLSACNPMARTSPSPTPSPLSSPLASPTTTTSPATSPGVGGAMQQGVDQVTTLKTIILSTQNNSGQDGTAVIAETRDKKLNVTLNMKGGNFTQPQPAHIHVGMCPNPGAVKYPLTNVVNGKSETVLNVTMDEFLAIKDSMAINVHKSAAESNVYTACGNITK